MTQANKSPTNRREAFRSCLRWLAFGGIATLSAGLMKRDAGSCTENDCDRPLSCSECALIGGCQFPKATTRNRKPR